MISKQDKKVIEQIQLDNLKQHGTFNKILTQIQEDEYDYVMMPHYGMVPDWYHRWHDLKEEVKKLLG